MISGLILPVGSLHLNLPQVSYSMHIPFVDRFTKEAKEKRHPFAYLPFGTGPRNCIGMRFALLTLKLSVVRMVQSFKFEPCEETPVSYRRCDMKIVQMQYLLYYELQILKIATNYMKY